MLAGLLTVFSAIGQALKVLGVIMGWLQEERQMQIGVKLQQGADAQTALAVSEAMAKAAAEAPKTQDEAVSRFMEGSA